MPGFNNTAVTEQAPPGDKMILKERNGFQVKIKPRVEDPMCRLQKDLTQRLRGLARCISFVLLCNYQRRSSLKPRPIIRSRFCRSEFQAGMAGLSALGLTAVYSI